MNKRARSRKEQGFTLIELMIVVAIIGILAALALPKFASLIERSREAATIGNWNAMRGAISIYYGDREGVYPNAIETTATYEFSAYLERIPPVRATHQGIGAGTVESPSGTSVFYTSNESTFVTGGTGWRYNSLSGKIFVNSASIDSRDLPYSSYGY